MTNGLWTTVAESNRAHKGCSLAPSRPAHGRELGAGAEIRTRVSGVAPRCLASRPRQREMVLAEGLEPPVSRFVTWRVIRCATRAELGADGGSRTRVSGLGTRGPAHWTTSACWHRRPESDRRDAALETAPAPLPRRAFLRTPRGWADGTRTRVSRSTAARITLLPRPTHQASREWSLAPESNRPGVATRDACHAEREAWRTRRASNPRLPHTRRVVCRLTYRPGEVEGPAGLEPAPSCLRGRRTAARAPNP